MHPLNNQAGPAMTAHTKLPIAIQSYVPSQGDLAYRSSENGLMWTVMCFLHPVTWHTRSSGERNDVDSGPSRHIMWKMQGVKRGDEEERQCVEGTMQ